MANHICLVQVEKVDVTTVNGVRIEEPIITACGFKAPDDKAGAELMQAHLKQMHGIHPSHR